MRGGCGLWGLLSLGGDQTRKACRNDGGGSLEPAMSHCVDNRLKRVSTFVQMPCINILWMLGEGAVTILGNYVYKHRSYRPVQGQFLTY
jgi:hypothetical protein